MRLHAFIKLMLLALMFYACHAQPAIKHTEGGQIGGPFENSDFTFIGMPRSILATDTSPGWAQAGTKLLIEGTVYQRDAVTPAEGVVLYYYHTNTEGRYASRPGMDARVARHGYIRGWVKTGKDGRYAIYTVKPAPYPGGSDPAHIHPAVIEPGIEQPYYLDDLVFDDDKLLTTAWRKAQPNRGGSGVLRPYTRSGMLVAEHDIILGLNIPNYSQPKPASSGLEVGLDQPSFTPYHAWGPDKGSKACPVCKYGRYMGMILFVGNQPITQNTKAWLAWIEQQSLKHGQYLKGYFVYGNSRAYSKDSRQKELEQLGQELGIKQTALTCVPSLNDTASEVYLNRLHPTAENTLVMYKNGRIVYKLVNAAANPGTFVQLSRILERNRASFQIFADR